MSLIKRCQDIPIHVQSTESSRETICTQDAVNVKKQIPKKVCKAVPNEKCIQIPRHINNDVPQTLDKKVCSSTKPASSGYGSPAPSYGATSPSYGHKRSISSD
jgi:hypothetical protein